MEDTPTYQKPGTKRTPRLKASLSRKGTILEGKRTDPNDPGSTDYAYIFEGEPQEFEARIEVWKHSAQTFNQEAARSLEAVLEEHYAELAAAKPNPCHPILSMTKNGLLSSDADDLICNCPPDVIASAAECILAGHFTISDLALTLNYIASEDAKATQIPSAMLAALKIAGRL